MVIALLVLYFVALGGASMLRSRPSEDSPIQLLRVFFPSWKFFDDIGLVPRLYVRTAPQSDALESAQWVACNMLPARRFAQLFYNPHGNYALACHSLLQSLLRDADEAATPRILEHSTSFQLTRNLALQESRRRAESGQCFYQFKICSRSTPSDREEDHVVSPTYEVMP